MLTDLLSHSSRMLSLLRPPSSHEPSSRQQFPFSESRSARMRNKKRAAARSLNGAVSTTPADGPDESFGNPVREVVHPSLFGRPLALLILDLSGDRQHRPFNRRCPGCSATSDTIATSCTFQVAPVKKHDQCRPETNVKSRKRLRCRPG